jgi:hypothetical protein
MANATSVVARSKTQPEHAARRVAQASLDYVEAVSDVEDGFAGSQHPHVVAALELVKLMDHEPSPWPERMTEIQRTARKLLTALPAARAVPAENTLVVPLGDAAVMLGITRDSAYRMVREGRFPVRVVRVGGERSGKLMVSRRRLEEYVDGPDEGL